MSGSAPPGAPDPPPCTCRGVGAAPAQSLLRAYPALPAAACHLGVQGSGVPRARSTSANVIGVGENKGAAREPSAAARSCCRRWRGDAGGPRGPKLAGVPSHRRLGGKHPRERGGGEVVFTARDRDVAPCVAGGN